MRIKSGYVMRKVGVQYVIVALEKASEAVSRIMKVNETGALIWNGLKEGLTKEQMIDKLMEEYAVEKEEASADVEAFLQLLQEADLLEM